VSTDPAYIEPRTIDECLDVLERYGEDARIVAGATAVTLMLRQGLIAPEALVSLRRLDELRRVELDDGVLRLGALVTHADVVRHPLVAETVPMLARSFAVVGNVRVRAAATVGGVVAEADYASDPPTALLALDAAVSARSSRGERMIPISEFFIGFYETALIEGELVTEVRVPVPPAGTSGVYEKFRTRSSEDRPCLGVAALVHRAADATCDDLRVAVGAASEIPFRRREIERAAIGEHISPGLAAEIGDAYASDIDTLDDARGSSDYRREIVRVWVKRAILAAVDSTAKRPNSS
jgi:carbon-monoxide dehydrogenase medium subunit